MYSITLKTVTKTYTIYATRNRRSCRSRNLIKDICGDFKQRNKCGTTSQTRANLRVTVIKL